VGATPELYLIYLFIGETEMPKESCPLDWWKVHGGAHPLLANLAIRYLGTPATTVPCKRILSKSGLIVSNTRAALSPANVNKLVCLNNRDWACNDSNLKASI